MPALLSLSRLIDSISMGLGNSSRNGANADFGN